MVRDPLGIDLEGGTEPDNFERTVEGNREFRMEMVRQAETDQRVICWRNWPYKDEGDMPFEDIYYSITSARAVKDFRIYMRTLLK